MPNVRVTGGNTSMARILIIDEPASRAMLATPLGATGHTIATVGDGAAELAHALNPPPDLVIADILLPELDGYALARQVSSDPALARTRIVFAAAAHLLNEAYAIAAACGVAHVLAKPAEPATILDTVAAALAGPPPDALAHDAALERAYPRLLASEAHFRMLVENAPDLIQRVTPDARLVYVNQAWLRTLGYTTDEVDGLRLWDIVASEDLPVCQQLFARVLAGEALDVLQAAFVCKDGRRAVLEGQLAAQRVDGRIIAVQAFFRDITTRKQAEAQAHASAIRLRVLADASRAFAAAGIDEQAVLDLVARRTVELLCDFCLIRAVSDDRRWLQPVAMYAADP